jgi:hypothetical protein
MDLKGIRALDGEDEIHSQMSRGAKRVPLVPQYVKMMGAKSTHINNNNKLGGTNYGSWKFQLKNILI